MPLRDIKIFQLLPDDKDIAAIQPESLLVPPKPESPLSPRHQENQSKRDPNNQQEDQQQPQDQEQEQDERRSKRKWDDFSRVEILETPRNSDVRCYCPPRPPRKPKASLAMKGRALWSKRSVVFLDVAREVESMFPPSVLRDFGKKIKKARS
ncbi:unnamed protein product [Thlaspi arvense]|uniref:Uncharacterized protein n=1 Tax=Thlaspi arvense TaxID=13288 RepID=A0AAU9SNQ8_THLAR|nr:unnamed protein product [Thlaspi arvense]